MSFGLPAAPPSQATIVDDYTAKHLLSASRPYDKALEHALSNSTK